MCFLYLLHFNFESLRYLRRRTNILKAFHREVKEATKEINDCLKFAGWRVDKILLWFRYFWLKLNWIHETNLRICFFKMYLFFSWNNSFIGSWKGNSLTCFTFGYTIVNYKNSWDKNFLLKKNTLCNIIIYIPTKNVRRIESMI